MKKALLGIWQMGIIVLGIILLMGANFGIAINLYDNKKRDVFCGQNNDQKGKNELTVSVAFEDFDDFVVIPSYAYEVSWQRLEDEDIDGYRAKYPRSYYPHSIVANVSFKKIWERDMQIEFPFIVMQNLLYFEVLENQDDVVLCLIQDRYLNRGVKDSLIFTKMDNEYKLARAFQINNQDEHSDLCTIYKMNFTTIGDRIDLVHSKWEEIETKKKYRIGKLEQWDLD